MAKINVGFNSNTKEVTVQPMTVRVNKAQEDIEWAPQNGAEIVFVGFAGPVGDGCALSAPTKQSTGRWTATDRNDLQSGQTPVYFKYTVWVEAGGVVYARDPEIVNDPPTGA